MACFGSAKLMFFVFAIFFTSFPHTLKILVEADDQLIYQECHNTEVPELCVQCVKSNVESGKADKVGIAAILIGCLDKQVEILVANMSSLASETKDKRLKNIFQGCSQGYLEAKKDISTAKSNLEKRDYDQTNGSLVNALRKKFSCDNSFEDSKKLNIPNDVVYEMRVYEELSEATMRIIDGF